MSRVQICILTIAVKRGNERGTKTQKKLSESRSEGGLQQWMNKDDKGPLPSQSLSPGLVTWLCCSSLKAALGG